MKRLVGMALMFYPRGGSAQVVRYLARALEHTDWNARLAVGSLGAEGQSTHAATFFDGLQVEPADYTPALERFESGGDHLSGAMPFHGSLEDRPGAPDRIFLALDPRQTEAQVEAWENVLERAGFGSVDAIHLHHLTPMHEAVARRFPSRPLVTHLHGTELKMLEPAVVARYRHGARWATQLSAAARRSQRIICVSPYEAHEAVRLLGVPEDLIDVIPNGVDTERFCRQSLSVDDRLALLHRWLVEDPQGWDESGVPGSISYPPAALESFVDRSGEPLPLLLFVGRFLDFKRVPLLVRAYARARSRLDRPAPLIVWGGSPGEWEGEHPYAVVRSEGIDGVFFTGWRGHDELPLGLSMADGFVAPSVDEPFGQVLLEAMACRLPVITTRTGGPLSFVNTVPSAPNGWLVEPDDTDSLADAIVSLVDNASERRNRGTNAHDQIRSTYSWSALAHRFTDVYQAAIDATF